MAGPAGIFAFGFRKPSAIQQRAIVPIMSGRDVIAQSQSGTGKTAVMCIGSLQNINESKRLAFKHNESINNSCSSDDIINNEINNVSPSTILYV